LTESRSPYARPVIVRGQHYCHTRQGGCRLITAGPPPKFHGQRDNLGDDTILIDHCQALAFDRVEVLASTGGIRFADSLTGATFRNCRFVGGLSPWFFRGDRKNEYSYMLRKDGPLDCNKLGKATVDVLMHGIGADLADVEIDHCEFVNGHDLYLVAANTQFHHNWIEICTTFPERAPGVRFQVVAVERSMPDKCEQLPGTLDTLQRLWSTVVQGDV
jgi:hypothetical protein